MAIADTVKQKFEEARARVPVFDHLVRMVQHYGVVKGNALAGAVTFFGFLSFFPILALAFAIIGYVVAIYPDADDALVKAIGEVMPVVTTENPPPEGYIHVSTFSSAAGTAAGIGAVGVLYAGLGWLSGMRDALLVVFEKPQEEQPNFFVGKLRDLISLGLIGVTLIVSVAVSGVVSSLSKVILDFVGLGEELAPLLQLLTVVIGLATNAILFYALFRLLANPATPKKSLWSGALLGGIGFEVLKRLSAFLIGATTGQPAFAVFGITLVLVVWINYFSRVVMYAASWAHTSPAARAEREAAELADRAVEGPQIDLAAAARTSPVAPARSGRGRPVSIFAAGAASSLGVLAWLKRRKS